MINNLIFNLCNFTLTQLANNVLRISPNGPILVQTSRTIIGPKEDISAFWLTLAVHCLMYNWNQVKQKTFHENQFYGLWLNWCPEYVPRVSHCGCVIKHPLVLQIGQNWDVLRTSRRYSGTSSRRPWDVILSSIKNSNSH